VVVVYLFVVPGRLRAALALIPVGLALLLARGELLHLYKPIKAGQDPSGPIHSVLGTIGLSAAAVLVAWTVVSLVDRRVELSAGAARSVRLAAITVAAVAIVGGAAAVGLARPSPEDRVSNAWRDFKSGQPAETGNSYFGLGLGSNRYDFWRVALREFRDHPIRGVGVDNFAQDYVRERRSSEEPLYPHSLILRVLAQTGIVGAILFGGFVIAGAIAAGTAVWRRADFSSAMTRAGLAAVAYFAIHGSIDWFWEFPGLAAPAFAWLGLAAGQGRVQAAARRLRLAPTVLAILVAAAIGASFLFPWLAELDARRASDTWAKRPTGAFTDLERARALNPLSARADLLAGAIASRLNEVPRMRSAFQGALERDPRNWYAHLELGLAEAALGHKRAALNELGEASRLNPREEMVASVRREVAAGRTVDRAQVDRQFVERVRGRVGP
jgi:tetratricopeptide (TPR) repeat protein